MANTKTKNSLTGKVILVTGAGSGIGRSAALCYAKNGANIVLLGRTHEKLKSVAQEIEKKHQRQTLVLPIDLENITLAQAVACIDLIINKFKVINGVLHNAGILGGKDAIIDLDLQDLDKAWNINLRAEVILSQVLLPELLKQKNSRMIFTSSGVAHRSRANWGVYAISKFAVEGLMQTLADEYKNSTLRINSINPGGTRTAMRAQAKPLENPKDVPHPDEIMSKYLYLMADASQKIHGQCLNAQE